ncbi:MAG: hypothetical protein NTY20_04735 [Candidatus Aenigmarchaeota archaeon]|nr:hypothetical protein [Candidatus Aenigmarchaeota archaeon]
MDMRQNVKRLSASRQSKGQMYSIIAVFVIIPLIIFIAFYITTSQNMKFGTNERVVADQQHQVEQGIENDFVRAVKITGRRALLSAVNNVIMTGNYLDNSTLRIKELITNSSIYGNPSTLMANNSLYEWLSRIASQNHSFDVHANFSYLKVENYDGMNIKISMLLIVNVSDRLNISRIDRSEQKDVIVSVEGLEDPMFPLSTTGSAKIVVNEYPFSYYTKKFQGTLNAGNCSGNSTYNPNDPAPANKILVVQNTTGITDLTLQGFRGVVTEASENLNSRGVSCFVSGAAGTAQIPENQTVYVDSSTASAWLLPIKQGAQGGYYYKGIGPNFLQRLEGDLSESPDGKGIESFVRDEIGIPDKPTQTRVDYLFFSEQSYQGCRKARWVEETWLRLQASETAIYNLTDLAYSVC